MEKTQEQNDSRHQEIIENFIEQLKGEYKDFSAVISVNDGERTSSRVHGSTLDLINNVECIEENEAYKKVKKVYQKLNEFKEVLELTEED
jgi:hypothetical protein